MSSVNCEGRTEMTQSGLRRISINLTLNQKCKHWIKGSQHLPQPFSLEHCHQNKMNPGIGWSQEEHICELNLKETAPELKNSLNLLNS